jgi:hypothetical protein
MGVVFLLFRALFSSPSSSGPVGFRLCFFSCSSSSSLRFGEQGPIDFKANVGRRAVVYRESQRRDETVESGECPKCWEAGAGAVLFCG